MKYCYSYNEEEFTGEFDSRESAEVEAFAERGDNTVAYIGEVTDAKELLYPSSEHIGDMLYDFLKEDLYESVGEAVDNFVMTSDQQRQLGQAVIDYVEQHFGFNCFGVKNVVEVLA